jgi:hypothetical protein
MSDTHFKVAIASAMFTALCAGVSLIISIMEMVKHVR